MRWKVPDRFLQSPCSIQGRPDDVRFALRPAQEPQRSDRSWEPKPARKSDLLTASWPSPQADDQKRPLKVATTMKSPDMEGPKNMAPAEHGSPAYSPRAQNREKMVKKLHEGDGKATWQQPKQSQTLAGRLELPPLTPSQKSSRQMKPPLQPRHLRLLTPGTRANKSLYQTWHGRPTYTDYHTSYRGSMFAISRRGYTQEYLIHPDWS